MTLRRRTVLGLAWTTITDLFNLALQLLQIVVIARLLSPGEIGLFAIVVAIMGFVNLYSDLGMNAAVIQRQDTTSEQLSSIYWLNVGTGIILYVAIALLAAPLAWLMEEPELTPLVRIAALPLLIAPFGQQYAVLLEKALDFRSTTLVETSSVLAATVSVIGAAYLGYGVYALVLGGVVGAVVALAILIAIGWPTWRPQFRFRLSDLKGYMSFGGYSLGQRTVEIIAVEYDKIILALFVGTQALGIYYMALRMATLPFQRMVAVVHRVLFPAFSQRQDNLELFTYGYFAAVRALSTVMIPVFTGATIFAPWFVPILLGPGWSETVFLFQVLAISNLAMIPMIPAHSLVLARGHAKLKFIWSIVFTAIRTPIITIAILVGEAQSLVLGIMLFRLVIQVPFYRMMIASQLGPSLGGILKAIAPSAVLSAVFAVPAVLMVLFLPAPSPLIVATIVGAFVLAYAAVFAVSQRRYLRDLLGIFRKG